MRIVFQKKKDFYIIKIFRDDESYTWSKTSQIGVLHDICHYAVEKTLNFKEAFYGLINQGYEIQDFEKARAEKLTEILPANLPLQAIQTEYMAGLFQLATLDSNIRMDYFSILKNNMQLKNIAFPEILTEEKAVQIQEEIDTIFTHWKDSETELELSLEI